MLAGEDAGFVNKGMRVLESDSREGMRFIYFSRDEKHAYLAAYYEQVGDERNLGLELGYPECCVDYFCKTFSAENTNPEHKPTNPLTNISKRDKDWVLLSHFPCSSDCEASIALGKQYYEILRHVDKGRAEEMLERLKTDCYCSRD